MRTQGAGPDEADEDTPALDEVPGDSDEELLSALEEDATPDVAAEDEGVSDEAEDASDEANDVPAEDGTEEPEVATDEEGPTSEDGADEGASALDGADVEEGETDDDEVDARKEAGELVPADADDPATGVPPSGRTQRCSSQA